MRSTSEYLGLEINTFRNIIDQTCADLRVAVPGIIKSFNPTQQTVTVQITLRELITIADVDTWRQIPVIVDVPIFMPRAGGYVLTLPIQAEDECLVVFGDNCIDAWWQSGGVQNQIDKRRHDLSDGFALCGVWSQPRVISGYSTDSAQLRNEDGIAYVEIKGDDINIQGTNINLNAVENINVTAGANMNLAAQNISAIGGNQVSLNAPLIDILAELLSIIAEGIDSEGGGNTTIEGRNFLEHTHSDVQIGTDDTGGVV